MSWNLTPEQKKKLIDYMWKVGFIVDKTPLMNLKTDKDRFDRIREYVKDGYRIMIMFQKPEVVNINGQSISDELYDEIMEAYKWLTSNSEPKGSTHNSD